MEVIRMARKLWWRKKKAGWTVRVTRALVALAGGARGLQRRLSHS